MKNPMESKPVFPLLMSMAVPPMVSMLIQSMYNIVDSIFVARLGEEALTAVSLAYPLQNLVLAVAVGLGVGANAGIARNLGAKNQDRVDRIAAHTIFFTAVHAIIFILVGIFLTKPFLQMFTPNENVLRWGCEYSYIVICLSSGSLFHIAIEKMFQSCGDMVIPMAMQALGAIINIILDPIMIFGYFGFPALGVKGAAIATIISQTLSAAYVFYFLRKKAELKVRVLSKGEWKACRDDAKNIVSLGSAGFIMQLTNSLVTICCNSVLSGIGGDVYISVMTIVSSVRQMVETPIYAINEGTSPILSYNYGARRPMKVKKAIRVLTCMILIYTAITWSVIIFEPEFLIGIFSTDRELLADCVDALKLYFAAFIFMDLQYVGQTVFKSLNKKKQAIFFSLLRKVFIVVPLTYLFPYAFHMGTRGVFLAEPISNVIGGSLCFITMLVMLKRSI